MRWADRRTMRAAVELGAPALSTASADRKLDPAEAYFYLMDRVTSMHIVVLVERSAPWKEALVRAALDRIQSTDILLRKAIHVSDDGASLSFADAPGKPIPFESIFTDTDAWTPWVEGELQWRFEAGQVPLMRCAQLHSLENGRACLVLALHHAIGDGRAAASIATRLVDHMAALDGSYESSDEPCVACQPPAMHEVFPAAFRWAEHPGAHRKAASAILREAVMSGLPSDLPWFRDAAIARKIPRYCRITLEGEELQRLRANIRTHGVSLYGVLCAAQLLSQYRLLGTSETLRLLLTTPVDMRQHVDCAVGTAPTQLYASMVHATYPVGPANDVWSLARAVIERTRLQIARGDGHFFYSASDVAMALKAPGNPAGFANLLARTPHGSVMSVLGRIPTITSDPKVESIGFVVCSARHHALFSVANTYRHTLSVDVGYDDGNLAEGIGRALVAGIRDVLTEAAHTPS